MSQPSDWGSFASGGGRGSSTLASMHMPDASQYKDPAEWACLHSIYTNVRGGPEEQQHLMILAAENAALNGGAGGRRDGRGGREGRGGRGPQEEDADINDSLFGSFAHGPGHSGIEGGGSSASLSSMSSVISTTQRRRRRRRKGGGDGTGDESRGGAGGRGAEAGGAVAHMHVKKVRWAHKDLDVLEKHLRVRYPDPDPITDPNTADPAGGDSTRMGGGYDGSYDESESNFPNTNVSVLPVRTTGEGKAKKDRRGPSGGYVYELLSLLGTDGGDGAQGGVAGGSTVGVKGCRVLLGEADREVIVRREGLLGILDDMSEDDDSEDEEALGSMSSSPSSPGKKKKKKKEAQGKKTGKKAGGKGGVLYALKCVRRHRLLHYHSGKQRRRRLLNEYNALRKAQACHYTVKLLEVSVCLPCIQTSSIS